MKIKSLNTINTFEKLSVVDYELPHTEKSEYIVDDSCFIPMSEAIKQLSVNGASGTNNDLMYDFMDGKDTGKPVPIGRSKDCKDIAEISTAIMNDVQNMAESMNEARKANKLKADFDKSIADIKAAAQAAPETTPTK